MDWTNFIRRSLIFLFAAVAGSGSLAAEPMPEELRTVLKTFRAEGARSWAFTQKTEGAGRAQTERFDPRKPEFQRWTLLEKDGRAPTEQEVRDYNALLTRRSRGETAPNVKDQLDDTTAEKLSDDGERARWRFRLKTTDKDDTSAPHMHATFVLHRPTATIERVELANFEPFKPVFGISIEEARTVIDYSLPDEHRPTLLKAISVRLRGRTWWIKALNQDMTVTYSDFEFAGKK